MVCVWCDVCRAVGLCVCVVWYLGVCEVWCVYMQCVRMCVCVVGCV